ncbi:hypothetical protein N3K66_008004 [Trichothecium roseum]|uniref:Uncharacterized protein n=1 Tax=Trichothecium roseum TaxID=47278 RepID=A0ACC0UTZ2_9HYPO|nr:hypothetical protein N3K66_008004 [Trichothecium roseum]
MAAIQHYYQTPGHIVAAGIALPILDIAVVALRFASRLKSRQPLGPDDWLLIPATILVIGVGACLVIGVLMNGFGYREVPTSKENPSAEAIAQMEASVRLEWSINVMLPVALGCTKASFIFFYRRIFSIKPRANRLLWAMIVFIACWTVSFLLGTLLCCILMQMKIWKPVTQVAQCSVFLKVLMAFYITGFVTDLVVIAIPIPLVMSLKLSAGQKLVACGSFLLGTVTVACALARVIVSIDFFKHSSNPENDNILNSTTYVYWGMVEASMGVFAACLPTLQIFLRSWISWVGWDTVSNRVRSLWSSDRSRGSSSDSSLEVKSVSSFNSGSHEGVENLHKNSYP